MNPIDLGDGWTVERDTRLMMSDDVDLRWQGIPVAWCRLPDGPTLSVAHGFWVGDVDMEWLTPEGGTPGGLNEFLPYDMSVEDKTRAHARVYRLRMALLEHVGATTPSTLNAGSYRPEGRVQHMRMSEGAAIAQLMSTHQWLRRRGWI